jgi:hypothetical protein
MRRLMAELLAKSTGPPTGWTLLAAVIVVTILAVMAEPMRPGLDRRHRRPRRMLAASPPPAPVGMPTPVGGGASSRSRVTPEYTDYIHGRIPGRDHDPQGRPIYWPERVKPWKAEFRRRRGRCEIGRVLARGRQRHCGPAVVVGPIHADHISYRNLFMETRADVALGCASCHQERERLKRRGIDIYELWGTP